MKKTAIAALLAVTSAIAAADSTDGKPVSNMGPTFRRYSVAYYGKPLPSWADKADKTREGYRVWMDAPCGKGDETGALMQFIAGLMLRTNGIAATSWTRWQEQTKPVRGIEAAIKYRRDKCFEFCEKGDIPTGGMMRGSMMFADDRYISYTVSEHCWFLDHNAGDFVISHGVFDRKNRRQLGIADLFPEDSMEELTNLLRMSFVNMFTSENFDSWEDFRKKYPAVDAQGNRMKDPSPTDGFILDDFGMVWSFNDADIVSKGGKYDGGRILDVPISWRILRRLLRDRALVPSVNSVWDCNIYRED